MDFAKGERVKLKHWGDTATVVALPDEVNGVTGLRGHFRIKLDDAAKGFRYVTPDKLVRVERKKLRVSVVGREVLVCTPLGAGLARLTEAEAEALVAALQHALAELAINAH